MIEFDYDSIDGRELKIIGHYNNNRVHFKVYHNQHKLSNATLTSMDISNIEQYIEENQDDLEY